jgi:hypothetical protein
MPRQKLIAYPDGTSEFVDLTPAEEAARDTEEAAGLIADGIVAAQASVAESGDSLAASIPGWAAWTETEVLGHIDSNVTDLASAVVVLKAMARMVVALRNKTWPNLEDSA